MRQLRIVGVDTDGAVVECELTDSGEKLALPLDENLRAAARGESPSGTSPAAPSPARPPVTGTMRPKEIQDRIRHGAAPEDVAAEAGVPLSRIDGFAYPVLLERYSAAERARGAHPVLSDGPALDTLEERVAAAVSRKGIDPDSVRWDAWRSRAGGWVVSTRWPMGLSDDVVATWSYVPDSHGGAARPLDPQAEAVLDPERAAALRSVPAAPPVVPTAGVRAPGPPPGDVSGAPTGPGTGVEHTGGPIHQVPGPLSPAARIHPTPPAAQTPPAGAEPAHPAPPPQQQTTPPAAVPAPFMVAEPARGPHRTADSDPSGTGSDGTEADEDFLQHPPARAERKTSRRHPTMPSWEDVLLGVRGKDD